MLRQRADAWYGQIPFQFLDIAVAIQVDEVDDADDRLDELHKRLVCQKCGSRPAQEDVGIPEPVKFPGGPLYGPR